MKLNNTIIALLLSGLILLVSCNKDPQEVLPGNWNTSDGGTITFNEDGTGTVFDSDYFLFDCGTVTINGQSEYFGPVTTFEWQITDSGARNDNLRLDYDDQTSFSQPCSGSSEFPIKVNSDDKVTVGVGLLGIEVELTR